jgi:hypothetical protein
MALQTVSVGRRGGPGGLVPRVHINPKSFRLTFNKKGITLLDVHAKTIVNHVVLLVDPDRPDMFWIRPAKPTDAEARKLTRGKIVMCGSVRSLINGGIINYKKEEGSKSLLLLWDKEASAARANLQVKKQ